MKPNRRDNRREDEERPTQPSPMPRSVKYAWGVVVSALLVLSFFIDQASPFMPLVHRAIDALQTQTAPTENR